MYLGPREELEAGGEKEGHSQDELSLQDRDFTMNRKTKIGGAYSSQAKKLKNTRSNNSLKDLEEEGDEETFKQWNTTLEKKNKREEELKRT